MKLIYKILIYRDYGSFFEKLERSLWKNYCEKSHRENREEKSDVHLEKISIKQRTPLHSSPRISYPAKYNLEPSSKPAANDSSSKERSSKDKKIKNSSLLIPEETNHPARGSQPLSIYYTPGHKRNAISSSDKTIELG